MGVAYPGADIWFQNWVGHQSCTKYHLSSLRGDNADHHNTMMLRRHHIYLLFQTQKTLTAMSASVFLCLNVTLLITLITGPCFTSLCIKSRKRPNFSILMASNNKNWWMTYLNVKSFVIPYKLPYPKACTPLPVCVCVCVLCGSVNNVYNSEPQWKFFIQMGSCRLMKGWVWCQESHKPACVCAGTGVLPQWLHLRDY